MNIIWKALSFTGVTIVILVMALLFGGCTAINQFLCHPTETQTEAANVGLALAQVALTAAPVYTGGGAIISVLTSQAIPVFQKVVQGYCATQAEWDAATSALSQAQATTKAFKSPALEFVSSVKWNN